MNAAAHTLVELSGIDKSFRTSGWRAQTKRVLSDVGLEIREGEVVALVGESGSGKSTVARIISRLEQPDAGSIKIEGKDVLAAEPRRASLSYRAEVQMIFQDPFGSLNPVHSVRYHLERPLIVHGKAASVDLEAAVLGLLESVGLTPAETFVDRHPHELSGGQRQRVAIARAVAVQPRLVLADEPTSMLDVATRLEILELLRGLAEERGVGVLFITHDLASAHKLADRILVMYAGRIVERGPCSAVLKAPSHPYTRTLLGSLPNGDGSFRSAPPTHSAAGSPAATGCAFAPRCSHATEQCRANSPRARAVADGHTVSCLLYP